MRTRRSFGRNGFTLIELLVVIAIIALLAGLLLPSLTRAKQAARSAKCINNLRQIELGVVMYVDDHQRFPLYWNADEDAFYHKFRCWFDYLQPYVHQLWKDPLFKCPDYRLAQFGGPGDLPSPHDTTVEGRQKPRIGTYGYNAGGIAPYLGSGSPYGLGLGGNAFEVNKTGARNLPTPASAVQMPADCVVLTEAFMYNPVTRTFATDQAMTTPIYPIVPAVLSLGAGLNVTSAVRQQHGGKHPVAFMDGHVVRVPSEVLYINRTDAMLRRWNSDHQPHREMADY